MIMRMLNGGVSMHMQVIKQMHSYLLHYNGISCLITLRVISREALIHLEYRTHMHRIDQCGLDILRILYLIPVGW